MTLNIDLKEKICLVTGATRGIGKAIAETLANAGATVIGTATSEEGALKIRDHLKILGDTHHAIVLNVTDILQIENAIKQIEEQLGSVHVLVNNAGITNDNILVRMKETEWDAVINTNLTSVYRLSKAVIRSMMKARAGRIINVTSVIGHMGNAGQSNYAAAKAGITGFTKALAKEVGSRNITVNCIAPGFIQTDMTAGLDAKQHETLINNIPLGRLGVSQDIANAVLFLASDLAGYITGSTVHVNGGMLMD